MNARHTFVAIGCVFLYIFAWANSLSRNIGYRFWDVNYAREHHYAHNITNTTIIDGQETTTTTTIIQVPPESFFSSQRYIFYLPHVLGAFVWWNFYFLQLIPKVRHAYNKKFHRILGRVLFVAALLQVITGVGLCLTQSSNIVLFSSCMLALAVLYCLCHAYYFAKTRQIRKHKYWVLRMVGYLQATPIQRVCFSGILKFTYVQLNWHGLYPPAETKEEYKQVLSSMIDDSFPLSMFAAFLLTEWYLAAEQGMTDLQRTNENHELQTNEEEQDGKIPINHEAATSSSSDSATPHVESKATRHLSELNGEAQPLLPK